MNFRQHLSISSLHLAYVRNSFWNTHFLNTNLPGMYRYIHPLLYNEVGFFVCLEGGYWFHSVRPSVHPSVRPSRIPCPLCSAFSSGWIHFICIHLIKQLQKVCRVQSFWQNCKNLIFGIFFLNLQLWLCLHLTWDLMWITSMGNHEAAGVSQTAGVLVVLVIICSNIDF